MALFTFQTGSNNDPVDQMDSYGLAPLTEEEILRILDQLRNQLNNQNPPGSEGEQAVLREIDKWLDRLNKLRKTPPPPSRPPGGLGRACAIGAAAAAGYYIGSKVEPYVNGGFYDAFLWFEQKKIK